MHTIHLRKTLALAIVGASLVAGGSAFARQAGNDGFDVMNPATPDPEAITANALNGPSPQGTDQGKVRPPGHAPKHVRAHDPTSARSPS